MPKTLCRRGSRDSFSQRRHGRTFKEFTQRQLPLERGAHPRDDLGRQKRLTAKFEEIVMHTDVLDAEQFLPDIRNYLLGVIARRDVLGGELRPFMEFGGRISRGSIVGFEVNPLVNARLQVS